MMKLDNKGYLLVEIIVAFVIATAFMCIISDITIKVKNKNDDLMVRMQVTTDQTIVYNMIMREAYHYDEDGVNKNFSGCASVSVSSKQISYHGNVFYPGDYVNLSCNGGNIKLSVSNYGSYYVTPHTVNIKKYLKK